MTRPITQARHTETPQATPATAVTRPTPPLQDRHHRQGLNVCYRGRGELIDHLLVSHVLVKAVQTVTTGEIEILSITDQPSERQDEVGSDHRPVGARFELG